MSADTARTLRNMFRSVVQRDPMGYQQGTGPAAAVEGYQIAGKTGTAQQINPACGCYFGDVYWITFAGIAPPTIPALSSASCWTIQRNADGTQDIPRHRFFHNIAAWLLQRESVPLSADPGAPLVLQVT